MLYELICNGMNKSKWYESERWNEIKGENVSWSPPIGPTAYWALGSAPWSGEPNPNWLVGPCRTAHINREGGDRAQGTRFAGAATPTYRNPNPILKRAASDGMCSPPPLPSSAGSPPAPLDFSPPRWTTPTTPRHWRLRCCAARRNVKELTQSYG